MSIESTQIMTNQDLINWLEVLGKGYVKPDLFSKDNQNTTGVVKDTGNYFPFIMLINQTLCERAGLSCPDVSQFMDFKEYTAPTRRNRN